VRTRQRLRRTRSVQMIIAATMLAVPASAYALTGAATAPSHADSKSVNPVNPVVLVSPLPLRVSPRHVTFGHAVTVTGTAPTADAGRRVVLETAVRGTSAWRQAAIARIGRAGHFRFRLLPRRSATFRALEATPAATPTARLASASMGATPTVTVAARFALASGEQAVFSGSSGQMAGKLLPAERGRVVRLQARTARGWHTLASGRTGVRGGFRVNFSPGNGGESLRVLFGGDRHNARSVQRAGSVVALTPSVASWYDDAGNTACGFHAGLGVANKTLPCGTKVTFSYNGRTVTAVVDDRGPYVGGRTWDLNQTTAAALGFAGVGTVWASM
jgi:rare lipoprotein A